MKALIIDDELLAREELRRLLVALPEVEVVGEASHCDEGVALVNAVRPDLVFLDIEMPGGTGFDLLERIRVTAPAVIFTTAYEEHAVEAFRVNALDYLLKPIDPTLLAQAVGRFAPEESPSREDGPRADGERYDLESRVFVREGQKCWFVRIGSVRLFESEGNYTRLWFDGGKPMVYRALKVFEERLDPRTFFRANRQQIVNLTHVVKTDLTPAGDLVVTLTCGTQVEMSRRMAQIFRETMGV